MKKRLSYTIDVLLVGIILLLGYTQVSMMLNKKFNVPSAFGVSFLYIVTDSMDDGDNPNSMPAGTGIIIQHVKDPSTLKPSTPIYKYDDEGNKVLDDNGKPIIVDWEKDGDAVTFFYKKIEYADTHRIIETYLDESGTRWFKTMGDNPKAHKAKTTELWSEEYLIGKVTHHSKALGTFLEISSPQIAETISVVTKEKHTAWLFPIVLITPIGALLFTYIGKSIYKAFKEEKERDAKIDLALQESGINLDDEEAVELFRMKESFRLEYREELAREIENAKEEARALYEKERKVAEKEYKKALKEAKKQKVEAKDASKKEDER